MDATVESDYEAAMAGNKASTRSCSECGASFALTGIEVRFYTEQEIPLPSRCRACAREQSGGEAVYANAPRIVGRTPSPVAPGFRERIAAHVSLKKSKTR